MKFKIEFNGPERYSPKYSEDYIKSMPSCFEKQLRLETEWQILRKKLLLFY